MNINKPHTKVGIDKNSTGPWDSLIENAEVNKFEDSIPREQMKEIAHLDWDIETAKSFLFRLDKQRHFIPSRTGSAVSFGFGSYAASLSILPENGERMEIPDLKNWITQAFVYQTSKFKEDINEVLATGGLNSEEKEEPIRILNLIWDCEKNGVFQMDDFSKIQQTPEYQELRALGVECMYDDREFVHCWAPPILNKDDCRLYMCPRTDQMLGIMTQIIMKYNRDHKPYYFKFSRNGERNDRIVFYTTYDNIGSDINMLSEIQQEHPEFFEDMGKNPFWGKIDGAPKGVYFGESYTDHHESYGSIRGKAHDAAYVLWGEKNGLRRTGNFASKEDITDGLAEDFTALFLIQLEKMGIDPKHICFNL